MSPPLTPATVWLADLEPITTSGDGYGTKAVTLRGDTYVHSLALLPRSWEGDNWIQYALDGEWNRLTGLLGIEDGGRASAGAVFEIEMDGTVVWSEQVNVADAPAVIDLSVAGVRDLKIRTVETCRCAYWSNAVLADMKLE